MGQVWEQPQGWVQNPRLVNNRPKAPVIQDGEMEQWCQLEAQKALSEESLAAWQGRSGGWRRPTVWKTLQAGGAGGDAPWPPLSGPSQKSEARGGESEAIILLSPWHRAGGDGWGGENPKARGGCGNIFKSHWTKFSAKRAYLRHINPAEVMQGKQEEVRGRKTC